LKARPSPSKISLILLSYLPPPSMPCSYLKLPHPATSIAEAGSIVCLHHRHHKPCWPWHGSVEYNRG
jgi:hypothetical protein